MSSSSHSMPEPPPPKIGGGPEDDPHGTRRQSLSQGFLSLGFGLATATAMVVLFFLVSIFGYMGKLDSTMPLLQFTQNLYPNVLYTFFFGLVGGMTISSVYNMLIVHRRFLFGLETDLN